MSNKSKRNFGINLNEVKCPKCEEKQLVIRIPKSIKGALWGGNTCNNCGCKMDKYGIERD